MPSSGIQIGADGGCWKDARMAGPRYVWCVMTMWAVATSRHVAAFHTNRLHPSLCRRGAKRA